MNSPTKVFIDKHLTGRLQFVIQNLANPVLDLVRVSDIPREQEAGAERPVERHQAGFQRRWQVRLPHGLVAGSSPGAQNERDMI